MSSNWAHRDREASHIHNTSLMPARGANKHDVRPRKLLEKTECLHMRGREEERGEERRAESRKEAQGNLPQKEREREERGEERRGERR